MSAFTERLKAKLDGVKVPPPRAPNAPPESGSSGRHSPKSVAQLVKVKLSDEITIDIDPTNGGVLLDATELGQLAGQQYTGAMIKKIVIDVMKHFVSKHNGKIATDSPYYNDVMASPS